MAHDVFISHSSLDKPTADAICAALEGGHVRCWMAPRDILPGQNWSEAIIDGIGGCRLMVVVFSSHSNHSRQVLQEVERAVHKGLPIIPFRIENVVLSKSLELFLSMPHWLDALTPPLEKHIQTLGRTVQRVLGGSESDAAAAPLRSPPVSKLPQLVQGEVSDVPPDQWTTKDRSRGIGKLWKFLTGQ